MITTRRINRLAEMLPEIVYETDAEGRLTYLNQRGLEKCGLTTEDLKCGVHGAQFVIPEDLERVLNNMRRVASGEVIASFALTEPGAGS